MAFTMEFLMGINTEDTACQDLAGADVSLILRYCQSQGLKPTWEGERAWAGLHGHVWEKAAGQGVRGPQTWPFSAGWGTHRTRHPGSCCWRACEPGALTGSAKACALSPVIMSWATSPTHASAGKVTLARE